MISKKLEDMLNDQIEKEFYSAYFYLSMAAWLEKHGHNGYASWYYVQVKEERDHAMMMLDYLIKSGGTPTFLAIENPPIEFEGVMDIFRQTLEHEQFVTSRIAALMEQAQEERDLPAIRFLQWYVDEQEEEEENASGLIAKYQMVESSKIGQNLLDRELAGRTYSPPSIMVKRG